MAGDNTDVFTADNADVFAADNADVLAADTTDVLAADKYVASEEGGLRRFFPAKTTISSQKVRILIVFTTFRRFFT